MRFCFLLLWTSSTLSAAAPELVGGLVFPGINEAIVENPSTLPLHPTRSMHLLLSPSIHRDGTRFDQWGISLSSAETSGFAYGATYRAREDSHAVYLSGAYKLESVSMGLTIREETLEGRFSPDADLGISVAFTDEVRFAFTMGQLNRHPTLGAGIGLSKPNRYSLELNVRLPPPPSDGTTGHPLPSKHNICLHGTYYFSRLGFSYGLDYETRQPLWTHTLGALYRFNPKLSLLAELSYPLNHRFLLTYQF